MKFRELKLIFSILLIAIITISIFYNSTKNDLSDLSLSVTKNKQKILSDKNNWSQRKQRVKGVLKTDSPDKFTELHTKIRTAPGELKPRYSMNYRFTELERAEAISSLMKRSVTKKLNWIERGPGNVGGRTRAIVVDPDDTNYKTWFAGSVGGGIWKTTDGGASWIPLTDNLPNLAITCMAMAKSNPNIIYAGTGEGFGNLDAVDGNGIMKTTDKGTTWNQLTATATDKNFAHINRLIIDPFDENVVIVATNTGIFKTKDGGNIWVQVYSDSKVQDLRANPKNFNALYATFSVGVLRSNNAGDTWELPVGAAFGNGRIEIAPAFSDTNRVYASANIESVKSDQPDTSRIYVTTNGGTTWVEVPEKSGVEKSWMGSQGWYDNTIAVNPFNDDIIYFGGIDLWKAEIEIDSGVLKRTSVAITDAYNKYNNSNKVHADHHIITIFPIDESTSKFLMLDGNDGGVSVSYDAGNTFVEIGDNGYNTSQFYGVDKKPGESQYLGGMQDNGTYQSAQSTEADKTTKYNRRISGDGFEVSWHYRDSKKMIGAFQFNGIYKTEDAWKTFVKSNVGFNGWGSSKLSPFVSKIAKSYSDPDLLYTVTKEGVFKSENFGNSWNIYQISDFSKDKYFNNVQITISIAEPQVVWTGAYSNTLYITRDGGNTFTKINDNSFMSEGRLSGLDTHPTDEATAFVTFAAYGKPKVLRTTDYGQTWQDISGFENNSNSSNGFPNVAAYCVAVMPYNTDIIWVGTDIGLIESVDNGVSWHLANNGLPQVAIWEIRIVDDEVVVATHGRGIWSVALPELAGHKPPVATLAPTIISVNQNVLGVKLNIALRSIYDSTHILLDGEVIRTINANRIADTTIVLPMNETRMLSFSLISFRGSHIYKSVSTKVQIYELLPVQKGYKTDFTTNIEHFALEGLIVGIDTAYGFTIPTLNSPHPYKDLSNLTALLKVPIVVAEDNAIISYEDIALVEVGDEGSAFGSDKFWDYVIVEATSGNRWIPLADGYDALYSSTWKDAYVLNKSGDPSMYEIHTINLLDKFSAGDTIQIRFRLFSDDYTSGWGWNIKNLVIQEQFVGVENEENIPTQFYLSQNFPNPFNPSTKITYSLPTESKVELRVYNMLGELITTLVDETNRAGNHTVVWNARNLASGVYLCRITINSISKNQEYSSVKKMVLLK